MRQGKIDMSVVASTPTARASSVRIAKDDRQHLRSWAEAGYPHEACGLLIGEATLEGVRVEVVLQAPNIERERAVDRYELDPRTFLEADEQARARGLDVVGFWHSHPDAAAVPSETDLAAAWPGYAYLIVTVQDGAAGDMRVWSLTDGAFEEGALI